LDSPIAGRARRQAVAKWRRHHGLATLGLAYGVLGSRSWIPTHDAHSWT